MARLTDRLDIAVDWDVKPQTKPKQNKRFNFILNMCSFYLYAYILKG